MRYFIFCLILFFSCNAKTAEKDKAQVNKNPKLSESENVNTKNEKFNPPFYLKIFGVFTGSTFYDESMKCDKVFRVLLYNNEEHITVVVETIIIGDEGGSLKLFKQEKLLEKNLNLPDYSMNNVEFVNWINYKEIKLRINKKNFIVDLEKLTYK